LDLASTLSLIPDIGWIWNPLVGEETTAGAQTAALKGAKGARAGTKAGRAVRIVRLVRMVRIVKLYKMTAGDDDVDMEDTGAEPSKVGKKLTELTTRRVIIITLGMILMLPLLDQSVLRDDYGKSKQRTTNKSITNQDNAPPHHHTYPTCVTDTVTHFPSPCSVQLKQIRTKILVFLIYIIWQVHTTIIHLMVPMKRVHWCQKDN
jgi:hypothetical protein